MREMIIKCDRCSKIRGKVPNNVNNKFVKDEPGWITLDPSDILGPINFGARKQYTWDICPTCKEALNMFLSNPDAFHI